MTSGEKPAIVVPCFNEERRLDVAEFLRLAEADDVVLLFVNDGSTDGTQGVLERLAAESAAMSILTLESNQGKAEAVRQGMLHAIESGAAIVGYLDADLATPRTELRRLLDALGGQPELAVVLGSRIARLGSDIRRTPFRHYAGRAYGTLASLALGVAVYDTQCGAKVFRVNPVLTAALREPFRSPWSFDVLLLDRLFAGEVGGPRLPPTAFLEVPLEHWEHSKGSKVRLTDALAAVVDVTRLWIARKRRENAGTTLAAPDISGETPTTGITPQWSAAPIPPTYASRPSSGPVSRGVPSAGEVAAPGTPTTASP